MKLIYMYPFQMKLSVMDGLFDTSFRTVAKVNRKGRRDCHRASSRDHVMSELTKGLLRHPSPL
jgi:hypothetical protein